ncbi:hypothetical protein [Paenibacillus xylanexedens]|uniref:hypothetical protein n=1 Tax=Paenibacillus xylanexedens TaxID=528191 RepID=UPI0011A33CC9
MVNKIGLLEVGEGIKGGLMEGKICEGDGRGLVCVDREEVEMKLVGEIIAKDLNVKESEGGVGL